MPANRRTATIDLIEGPPAGSGPVPVAIGVPLPRGYARDADRLGLVTADGSPVPRQVETLQTWSDGSIKWALVDFVADEGMPRAGYGFGLDMPVVEGTMVTVTEAAPDTIVTTEAIDVVFRPRSSWLGDVRHARSGAELSGPMRIVVTAGGTAHDVEVRTVAVERRGTMRSAVRLTGTVSLPGSRRIEVVCRLQLFATTSLVQADVTVHNPHRAAHPDGFWELGDAGSLALDAVDVHVALPYDPGRVRGAVSLTHDEPLVRIDLPVTVEQSSTSEGAVSEREDVPLRLEPCVAVAGEEAGVALTPDGFWQRHPVAISAAADELVYSVLPARGTPHELQGGEQKTSRVWIGLGPDAGRIAAGWRTPPVARVDPEWQVASGAVPHLTVPADDRPELASLADAALDGPASFQAKRERIDEYGWRNFGDIFADHESTDPASPFVSHYNNQYDAVMAFACHWLRSGDLRWRALMFDLARHVVDIDIYHTDEDKPQYNHGLFWHTAHYHDAGRSTHRSYPRAPGVPGGGPSAEHDYSTGLLFVYYQTGDAVFRHAVIELAGWVIAMDDGRRTPVGWVDKGPTGWASATAGLEYQGPGRGCGNSIQTLLNAWLLTNERRYVKKAEELIRRSIHPETDIESLALLDAERRWSYTVFLQALGRYLDVKAERRELDEMYAYTRASLLHVARWMAAHEYPYLEKPELLEFPTETWAAQDIRKALVFDTARLHATDTAERERFNERAGYFFDESLRRLMAFETHTLARPLVLMLAYGFAHAWFTARPDIQAPPPSSTKPFPPPVRFEAQKLRVLRRLKVAAGIAGVGLLFAFAYAATLVM